MNNWFRRALIILTIGAGFLGFVGTLQAFLAANHDSWEDYAFPMIFLSLYAYGIVTGIRLAEQRNAEPDLLVYFGLQVPYFSSPFLLYQFTSGVQAAIAIVGFGVEWSLRLGSNWQFAFARPNNWAIGVNLFALIVFFVLCIARWQHRTSPS